MRRSGFAFCAFLLAFASTGCTEGHGEGQAHIDETPQLSVTGRVNEAALTDLGPLAYLDMLATLRRGCVVISDASADEGRIGEGRIGDGLGASDELDLASWIGPDEIAALVDRLDDTAPSAGVTTGSDSVGSWSQESSSVGREAGFLLAGARSGHYPPSANSFGSFDFDPDALRAWAENELAR